MQTRSEPVVSTFADTTMALAVFTVGTAASGKRTWAESLPSRFQHLRFAIVREEVMTADDVDAFDRWKEAVNEVIKDTPDVLVLCATNLNPAVLREHESWLRDYVVDVAIQYFPPTPLPLLIRWDTGCEASVGASALREQLKHLQREDVYWDAVQGYRNGL
ncbi:hypothetical protein JKG47_18940 [Acidithiobacillus sp. MC6.1]|nr:hypothetical protein [Acidithiobacillus sp. MC6.1]